MSSLGERSGRGLTEDERSMLDAMERNGNLSEMDRGRLRAYSMYGNQVERDRIDRLTSQPGSTGQGRDGDDPEDSDQFRQRLAVRQSEEFQDEYRKALADAMKEFGL